MFRTRDFVLLFTTIVFLIAAIGATLFNQWLAEKQVQTNRLQLSNIASTSDLVLAGSLPGNPEEERIQRLNRMREKVAAVDLGAETVEPAVIEEAPETLTTTPTSTGASVVPLKDVLTCAGYSDYFGFWDARGAHVVNREGVVVVERQIGTSTITALQLPAARIPAAAPTCLYSDVIGVANDGSLIRNDEVGLYSVFGPGTVIGYALDGFPIRGVADIPADSCGLAAQNGQYSYYISEFQETIIQCFSGVPTRLP